MDSMLLSTAKKFLDAYGGEDRWRKATHVEFSFSAWGLLFFMKWKKPFHFIRAKIDLGRPLVRFFPVHRLGYWGILQNHSVRIESADGKLIQSRQSARETFSGFRRRLWWDILDMLYFSGYAMWNYYAFPALLLRKDIEWQEPREGILLARFPPEIPTHCREQTFHMDPDTHLLVQHDYTAEIVGSWARAAHLIRRHNTWKGIPYPAKRRVVPRNRDGTPKKGPLLVGIEIHHWKLI
jgi:hypothetical protein